MTKLEQHHPYPSVIRLTCSSSTEKIYFFLEFFQKYRLEKQNKIGAAAESRTIPCESASLNSFLLNFFYF